MVAQFIGMQAGLGFGALMDPVNGVSVAAMGQFMLLLATVSFVSFDGHLTVLLILVDSFQVVPVSSTVDLASVLARLVDFAQWMWGAAFGMALPVVGSLLLVNLAFGVMTRATPQLNVFSLGFPLTLRCSLLALWVLLTSWNDLFMSLLDGFIPPLRLLFGPVV